MAGKVLNFILDYREGGAAQSAALDISFVSNWCIKEYNAIMEIVYMVGTEWARYRELKARIAVKLSEKADPAVLEELSKELLIISERIAKYKDADVERRRFNLIKTILDDNGINKFNTFEFWDRQVEPRVQNEFIEACAFKDLDKKKVV